MDRVFCPHCGERIYEPEWIMGEDFINAISPYINSVKPLVINGVELHRLSKTQSSIVRKLLRQERHRIKNSTAENILSAIGLDPHLAGDIVLPARDEIYEDADGRVLKIKKIDVGNGLGREVQGILSAKKDDLYKDYSCTLKMWEVIWRDKTPSVKVSEMMSV